MYTTGGNKENIWCQAFLELKFGGAFNFSKTKVSAIKHKWIFAKSTYLFGFLKATEKPIWGELTHECCVTIC